MDTGTSAGGLTALDYLRPVWRFRFAVVLVVALAAAGTYLYTRRETKVYTAATEVYVGQSSLQQLLNPTNGSQSVRTIADQAQLLQTPTVAAAARRILHLPYSPEALLASISAAPSATSDFLTVTAQTDNPELAAELANGFAQAYLQVSNRDVNTEAKASLAAIENQLHRLPPGSAGLTARQALRQQISTLQGIVSSPPPAGQQLTPAAVPGAPVSPNPKRDAIFAGALALALAMIVCYLIDRGDRRMRRLDDFDSWFDLPVLATVPHVRNAGRKHRQLPDAFREPFRTLRVNLDLARAAHDGAKVILVTSAVPAEGKSTIVRNLAFSYGEAGDRVAVVEADLRGPTLAVGLGIDQWPGLAEALAQDDDLNVQPLRANPAFVDSHGTIDVVVAGQPYSDPTVLLSQAHFKELLDQLAAEHDVVLVDSPSMLAFSDSLILHNLADGILLAMRAGTSTRDAAERMRRTLDRLDKTRRVPVLGVVANNISDDLARSRREYANRNGGGSASRITGRALP